MRTTQQKEESMSDEKMTYKDAGVDIDAGNTFVKKIKPHVESTTRPGVVGGIGGFGGLFELIDVSNYKRPVLVAGTDGVGTKLKLAFMADKHDTVGIDLVAMCVNDIVVQGAEPLFFLDYLATSKLDPERGVEIVKGIAEGCKQAGCALTGGETAELPGFYTGEDYDLAGFAVGIVEKEKIIDGSKVEAGNVLIGLASNGLHSNGYSLARKVILERLNLNIHDEIPSLGKTVAEELLTPTRIYVKPVLNVIKDFQVNGIAHITGGGLLENIPRVLPGNCKAIIEESSWEKPEIFRFIRKHGNIDKMEMYRTFNCGIGMVLIVPEQQAAEAVIRLMDLGEDAFPIGEVVQAEEGEERVQFVI